jgi:phosphoglycolate phosphatase-like HAD superfamily hydrolase
MTVYLFDIDGTLLSSGGAGKAAVEAAMVSEFAIAQPAEAIPMSGRTDRAIIQDVFRWHGIEDSLHNWQRFLAAYLGQLPTCLARHQGRVMPGIPALLGRLSARTDVTVGLLTGNVREGARLKLGHFGLFHYFTLGGFGDQHLDRDDVAREALAAVRRRLNGSLDLGRIWVIGDTPLDVRCARAIGVRAVAVGTGWHSMDELAAAGPDLLLPDLSDPMPLLSA